MHMSVVLCNQAWFPGESTFLKFYAFLYPSSDNWLLRDGEASSYDKAVDTGKQVNNIHSLSLILCVAYSWAQNQANHSGDNFIEMHMFLSGLNKNVKKGYPHPNPNPSAGGFWVRPVYSAKLNSKCMYIPIGRIDTHFCATSAHQLFYLPMSSCLQLLTYYYIAYRTYHFRSLDFLGPLVKHWYK